VVLSASMTSFLKRINFFVVCCHSCKHAFHAFAVTRLCFFAATDFNSCAFAYLLLLLRDTALANVFLKAVLQGIVVRLQLSSQLVFAWDSCRTSPFSRHTV